MRKNSSIKEDQMTRFVEVNPAASPTEYRCIVCGEPCYAPAYDKPIPEGQLRAYADLDGEPFEAYYCERHAK